MENQRAKEIAASPVMARVTYNGTPVYIEKVDDSSETCIVHYLKKPDRKLEVSVTNLTEH